MKAAWYNQKYIGEDLFTHAFILSFILQMFIVHSVPGKLLILNCPGG